MMDFKVLIVFVLAYYIIKWAVKNGINESVIGEYYENKDKGEEKVEIRKSIEEIS